MLADANNKSYCTLPTFMDLGISQCFMEEIFTDFLDTEVLSDF